MTLRGQNSANYGIYFVFKYLFNYFKKNNLKKNKKNNNLVVSKISFKCH